MVEFGVKPNYGYKLSMLYGLEQSNLSGERWNLPLSVGGYTYGDKQDLKLIRVTYVVYVFGTSKSICTYGILWFLSLWYHCESMKMVRCVLIILLKYTYN